MAMMKNTSNQIGPMLAELTQDLAGARFTPGEFQQVEAGSWVVTLRPTGEDDEQLLLVQSQRFPAAALAGSVIEFAPEKPGSRGHRGQLDRRGCTFVTGLAPGSYRLRLSPRPQEQRLPDPLPAPAGTVFEAAGETLLVQPLELSHGRLYWIARPKCLILLWQPTRPGAGGSARVRAAGGGTPGDALLLIPVAAKHQIVAWPATPGHPPGDVRLHFEGTDDTVMVPAAWFQSGIRYLAAALYDMDVPTLAETIERLDAQVKRRGENTTDDAFDERATPTVRPRTPITERPAVWVGELPPRYALSSDSTDRGPALRIPTLNVAQPGEEGDIPLRAGRDDSGSPPVTTRREQPLDLPRIPTALAVAAKDKDQLEIPETDHGWWVDPQRQRLVVRCPSRLAEFPYSAVFVELFDGDQCVGAALLPLDRDPAGTVYGNSLALAELLGERAYDPSLRVVFWAKAAHLRGRVTLAAVGQVLDSPYVRNRPNVRAGLAQLRDDLIQPPQRRRAPTGQRRARKEPDSP